jgi:arylsulfatase A-like enzyme
VTAASHRALQPLRLMRHTLPPLLFAALAALAASVADASYAFRGVLAAHGDFGAALAALIVATAVVACPLMVLSLAAAFVLRRVAPPRAAPHPHRTLGAIAFVACLGFASTRSAIAGRALIASMSPHLASTALVLLVVASIAAAWMVALSLVRALAPFVTRLEARLPLARAFTRGIGARLLLTMTIVLVLDALMPREYVIASGAGITAWLVATDSSVRVVWTHRSRGSKLRAFAGALLATIVIAPHAMARLPGGARVGVAQRPPYGSMILTVAHRVVDGDGDGYSPILGGGDCDDDDASVHPGARDVPDDGRDQDCSGADARRYAPPLARAPEAPLPPLLPPRPNIVLVVIDALRPDHLGLAGYARTTSPEIDRFRRGATWFRHAYTPAPNTRFALASMFTGLPVERIPQRRGHGHEFVLEPAADTLAERLDALGYDRIGFSTSYVMQHMPGMGQGFRAWSTPWPVEQGDELVGHDAALTTDAAIAYLDRARTGADAVRPFFLFAHYQCTHDPYVRHADHDFGPTELDAYDSSLAYCDEHVGRLLRALDAKEPQRNVVVVASDHGELFGEHGMDRHGTSLLEPAVRPLLLVRVPGCDVPTVDAAVTLTDVYPTLLALAGGVADDTVHAWNLGAFMFPGVRTPPPSRAAFLYVDDWRAGVHYEARGVVLGHNKLVRDLKSGAEALFDLDLDPGETRNVRRALPAVHAELAALLESRSADGERE